MARSTSTPDKRNKTNPPEYEVQRVRDAFDETINSPRFLDKVHSRSKRIGQIVSDFGFGKLNHETMQIAELYGVAEQLRSEEYKKKTYSALRSYRDGDDEWQFLKEGSNPDDIGDRVYAVGVVADLGLIDDFIEGERKEYLKEHKPSEYGNLIQDSQPSFSMIPPQRLCQLLSKNREKYPDCAGVQVEALLLKAAASFDDFRQALQEIDETQLQKALYEIEAFYAPACEILGYDAFAMAMRSETIKLRMIRKGETINDMSPPERIQKARDRLSKYPAEKVVEVVDDVIHDIFGADPERFTQSVIENKSNHGVAFGIGMILNENGIPPFEYVWRRKSEGALAKKYEKAGEPADIIGITVVADDVPDAQKVFNHIIGKVQSVDLDHIGAAMSQDRSTPYSAAGSPEFLSKIQEAMPAEVPLETRTRENGFEVAKVTILHKTIMEEDDGQLREIETPIEVMVMTKESRRNARTGNAAHIKKYFSDAHIKDPSAKYEDLDDTSLDTEDLKELSARRNSAKDRGLTPMGLARALHELKFMSLARHIQVGQHAVAAAKERR